MAASGNTALVLAAMVRKDLRRRFRSPLGLLITLAFPVLFAGMLAITFGGGGGGEHPRIRLLVEDRDGSLVSKFLTGALSGDQMAEHFVVEQVSMSEGDASGHEAIRESGAAALLRIPRGFGEALFAGDSITLDLVRNPSQSIMPEIATQLAQVLTETLDSASRALRQPLARTGEMFSNEQSPSEDDVVATSLGFRRGLESAAAMVMPPAITLRTETVYPDSEGDEPKGSRGQSTATLFLFVLPGVAVYALFMVGDLGMRDILTEINEGTLRRQLAGPISSRLVVVGKAASTALLASLSLAILAGIGALLLEEAVSVSGFVVLSGAVVLAVTGSGAAVYGAAGDQRRGATVASVVYLVLAFVGGAFVGMDNVPQVLHPVARISPFYWGGEGYRELLLAGGGITEIALNIAVLSTLGVAALALGGWLLNRRLLAGAA